MASRTAEAIHIFGQSARPKLRLDWYVSNVFNHPNWDNPSVNLSNAVSAGTITSAGGVNGGSLGDYANERTMNMSIRVEW